MPCASGPDYSQETKRQPTREEELESKMPAALCAVIRNFGLDHVLASIDNESGVTPEQVTEWWGIHQARDKKRKIHEEYWKKQEQLYQEYLAKLSPQ